MNNLRNPYQIFRYLLPGLLFSLSIQGPCAFGQNRPLSPAETAKFKQQVQVNAAAIKTLQSNFVQLKHLDFVENDIRSKGTLSFKSPQKVRWEYISPFHYFVVMDGQQMHIDDGGRKKDIDMGSNNLLKDLSKILVGTVQGDQIFDENKFTISYFKSGTGYMARFRPKDQVISKYIHQVELSFGGSSYLVEKIRITEPSMDYTEILFSDQKKNSPIPDEQFSLR